MRRGRRGYTLLEMLLVLALLVILAALAYPSVDGMYSGIRLRAGADNLRSALAQARAHAMDEGRSYRFAVLAGQGNYRVAPEGSAYWGGGASTGEADPDNPPLELEDKLPKGIVFTLDDLGGGGEGGWVPVVTFLPDGTATDDRQFTLRLPGCRPIIVRLRALTGMVTLE
jgi:prepilin-type N-terminal cleavage/methylation domain-containing protein